ncbi:MAG TPA: hypothetical protein VMH26_18715 [Burkholderiales bacterium]|nr:hypothetical protein [Burkholderiales bacterium]
MNEIIVLKEELHYVISLDEIMWGGLLLAVTIVIHGTGMVLTLRASSALKQLIRRFEQPAFILGLCVLIIAVWMIILIDLLEISVWSGFYVWKGAIPNPSRAYYYALVNYCTLNSGYLPLRWRLLEGMLGMAGLLTFAWSTGVIFMLAQEFQNKHSRSATNSGRDANPDRRPWAHHPSDDSSQVSRGSDSKAL